MNAVRMHTSHSLFSCNLAFSSTISMKFLLPKLSINQTPNRMDYSYSSDFLFSLLYFTPLISFSKETHIPPIFLAISQSSFQVLLCPPFKFSSASCHCTSFHSTQSSQVRSSWVAPIHLSIAELHTHRFT